jgi:hypothetical protein
VYQLNEYASDEVKERREQILKGVLSSPKPKAKAKKK